MPFLAAPIAAVIGGGFVTQLLVGTAFYVGGTLLSQALAPTPPEQKDPGVSLTMRIGGDNPLSFFVGTSSTAGHRVYAGAWGNDGQTPNAYFVDVLELANAPLDGLSGVYVNKERGTIRWDAPHPQYGYPIDQGRKGGKDHLWVKFYDGRQTGPDPYLRAKFGGLAERPYTEDMVGRETPYAIVTVRYNRDLWKSGAPEILFEVRGLRLYDIRKDSSAGGVGTHRRNNPATWEFSENPYVIAYNAAFMGVYVGNEWLWGLQNLPALRLPTSAWIAAMNEADRVLAAWGNQRQFTIGGEITVDMEPAAVLEEIAKSSVGRFIESAGSYKPRCGAPGTSVWSFGEAELLITDPRTITPFPGLEATHNTVEASYVEPGEAWGWKPAPTKSNAAYVVADGNRKLSAGLRFPMVSRNEQVQRLTYSYLEDGRRFRQLRASFHPITWMLEPGDVIDGTILSDGYVGKQFEILEMSGRRTFVQTMTLREIDPADFDPPSSARQDWSVGPIQIIYPPLQEPTGVDFAPFSFVDGEDRPRRGGAVALYNGGMDDIEYFEVQAKYPQAIAPFFFERYPYLEDEEAVQPIASSSFLPGTEVQFSGRYVPYSARDTGWSVWKAITIPNLLIDGELDVLNDSITSEKIRNAAITADKLMDEAVTNIKLADEAVGTSKIAVEAITEELIAAEAVSEEKIVTGAVSALKIAAGAVTTVKLDAGAVTAEKIQGGTITGDKIAGNTITGDLLVANSITARSLVITDFTNLVTNGTFNQGFDGWEGSGYSIVQKGSGGSSAIQNAPTPFILQATQGNGQNTYIWGARFPAIEGDQFWFSFDHAGGGAPITYRWNFPIRWYGANNAVITTNFVTIDGSSTTWSSRVASLTAPAGAAYVRVEFRRDSTMEGSAFLTNIQLRRKASAELIVDGAITADKLAANAVTAGKINAGAINTSNLIVNGVVVTDKIGQNAVTSVVDVYASGRITHSSSWSTLATLTINSVDGKVVVLFSGSVDTSGTGSTSVELQVLRNGTLVRSGGGSVQGGAENSLAICFTDSGASPGSVTYLVRGRTAPGVFNDPRTFNRSLSLMDAKR